MLGWRLVRIDGHSMAPRIPAGSYALFRRRPSYAVGDIVLVQHPRFGRIVKQAKTASEGRYALQGLAPESTSSEALGTVALSDILGRLVWLSKPPTGRA